jgi:actin related protein 2/3 complex subunit 5
MSAVNWRKIDIDALDPDRATNREELAPPSAPVSVEDIQSRGTQARALMSKGDYAGSLSLALSNPPYGGSNESKDLQLKIVLDILTAVRSSDVTPLIERLSTEEQNVLVKYLYKGMASPLGQSHGNGGVLLSWFEKTVDIAGQGPIIRYISDRRLL